MSKGHFQRPSSLGPGLESKLGEGLFFSSKCPQTEWVLELSPNLWPHLVSRIGERGKKRKTFRRYISRQRKWRYIFSHRGGNKREALSVSFSAIFFSMSAFTEFPFSSYWKQCGRSIDPRHFLFRFRVSLQFLAKSFLPLEQSWLRSLIPLIAFYSDFRLSFAVGTNDLWREMCVWHRGDFLILSDFLSPFFFSGKKNIVAFPECQSLIAFYNQET